MSVVNSKMVRLPTLAGLALAACLAGTGTGQVRPAGATTGPATRPRASARFDLPGVEAALLKPFKVFRAEVKKDKKLVGYIDWSAKKIVAVGRSLQEGERPADALMAQRAAATIALRNAASRSVGVRIGINGRVAGLKDGTVVIEGLIKDFKVTGTYSRRIGWRTYWYAEVHVPMFGVKSVAGKLFDAQLQAHRPPARRWRRARWVAPAEPAGLAGDVLVIDARGLGFNPSMYPLVLGGGQILIDMETVPKATAVNRGLCAYGTTELKFGKLQSLHAKPRAGARRPPARRPKPRRRAVRAIRAIGKDKSVLVVADKDALKLLKDPAAAGLARGGRVLVVVDAAAAGVEGRLPARPEGGTMEIASRPANPGR